MERVMPEPMSGCWLWSGRLDKDGYGKCQASGKNWKEQRAHRVAYRLFKSKIPKGKMILHGCDTPSCVNPEHLRPGTAQDNYDDSFVRGRRPPKRTHCMRGHELSEENVGVYGKQRRCKACHALRENERYYGRR